CCDGTGNRVRQFARICHPRRSSDSFRDHPHDRPVLLCLNENEGMGKLRQGDRVCTGTAASISLGCVADTLVSLRLANPSALAWTGIEAAASSLDQMRALP
ncbi:MAG TPA: hypothetical protein VKI44_12935, partial [Acetobacteraceae bacterium]|nr:hypothetical protein [Acetobacteraceae bacterium]